MKCENNEIYTISTNKNRNNICKTHSKGTKKNGQRKWRSITPRESENECEGVTWSMNENAKAKIKSSAATATMAAVAVKMPNFSQALPEKGKSKCIPLLEMSFATLYMSWNGWKKNNRQLFCAFLHLSPIQLSCLFANEFKLLSVLWPPQTQHYQCKRTPISLDTWYLFSTKNSSSTNTNTTITTTTNNNKQTLNVMFVVCISEMCFTTNESNRVKERKRSKETGRAGQRRRISHFWAICLFCYSYKNIFECPLFLHNCWSMQSV